MQTKIWSCAIPPSRAIQVPRHPRHVTRTSLFAFDCHLCPNRQVAGTGLGSAAGSGLDHQGTGDPDGADELGGVAGPADAAARAGEAAEAGETARGEMTESET